MRIFLLLFLALSVVGCRGEAVSSSGVQNRTGDKFDFDACRKKGGTPIMGAHIMQCQTPAPDAGKACNSSAECSGFCLAKTRSCTPTKPYSGCHEVYENGRIETLCVE